MHRLLNTTGHRVVPLPRRPWIMTQRWSKLVFLHWPVRPSLLGHLLPPDWELDTYDGMGWLAITPFVVERLRVRGLPPVPGLSRFPETNVRTYVRVNGLPGVHFFSLDAASRAAVAAARLMYRLPYLVADMRVRIAGTEATYATRRSDTRAPAAELRATYAPSGPVELADRGSFAWWATERYYFFVKHAASTWRTGVHHQQWPLQPARVDITHNAMFDQLRLGLPPQPPQVHYSDLIDVLVWPPERVA